MRDDGPRPRRLRLLGFLAIVIALATAGCRGRSTPPEPVAAELATRGAPYEVGGPIRVTFSLINQGETPVTVVRPLVAPNLVEFTVTGPDGKEIPFDGPWPRLRPFPEDYFAELAPGSRASQEFDLAEGFRLTRAGRYRVTAVYRNRDDGARFGKSALMTSGLESNPIEIEVR